jgi:hypothetical protein
MAGGGEKGAVNRRYASKALLSPNVSKLHQNKTKQNGLELLGFIRPNPDFSKGYDESK